MLRHDPGGERWLAGSESRGIVIEETHTLGTPRLAGDMVGSLGNPLKLLVCAFGLGISVSACGDDDGGTPPPSTAITKDISGNGDAQVGTVGQPLSQPIRVLVTDDGLPAPGITVTWSVTATGADLAASSISDAAGIASNTWTLGTESGPQTAQAAVTGASGSPVTFNATAGAGAATALAKIGGDGQQGPVNSELPEPLVTQVTDDFGNGVPGVNVNWATASGDATLSAPVVISDASGESAVQVVLNATEGPSTITASADGLTGSPQTFTVTALAAAPATATVTVANNSFQPQALTVAAGTTVIWQWQPGAVNHNVAPVGTEPPRSGGLQNAPSTYQHRFDTPGTYSYFCEAHAPGMSGVITVQ
jgi:plastocyanin